MTKVGQKSADILNGYMNVKEDDVKYKATNVLELAAQIGIAYGTDGHRADIGMIKTAKALAALDGRKRARKEDLERAARYVLPHRMRKNPLDTGEMDPEPMERILAGKPKEKEPESSREGD